MIAGKLFAIRHIPTGLFLRNQIVDAGLLWYDIPLGHAIYKGEGKYHLVSDEEAAHFLEKARKEETKEREFLVDYLCRLLAAHNSYFS